MSRHISEQFDLELDAAKGLLMEMGGLVERQVRDACDALNSQSTELALKVRETEKRVNRLEVELDEQCVQVIALRQPAATDLRMMISVMKASTDLERMGDEADRIAKMALAVSHLEYPPDHYADIQEMIEDVTGMVAAALDAFARMDEQAALAVIRRDEVVDEGYREVFKRLVNDMKQRSEAIELSLNILWTARALERIGDHAKNISEHAVYLVRGRDVRHTKAAE